MGTRADFYARNPDKPEEELVWLGSIAWDGFPDDEEIEAIAKIKSLDEYVEAVQELVTEREDGTLPEQGYPWPWEDSRLTDYTYYHDGDHVLVSSFGSKFFLATNPPDDFGDKSSWSWASPPQKNRERREND